MSPDDLKQLAEDAATIKDFQSRLEPLLPMLEALKPQLEPLLDWYKARQVQQISYPLDEASKSAIGTVLAAGTGTTALTQAYSVTGGAITGPKAYVGSIFITVDGKTIEVPYISAP